MLQFDLPGRAITAVAFHPDGRQLVAVGPGERVDVFDLPDGRHTVHPTALLRSRAAKRAAGFVAPNGLFAAVGGDYQFVVVDPRTWTSKGSYTAFIDEAPFTGGLSPDGRLVAVCRPERLIVDQFIKPSARNSWPVVLHRRLARDPPPGSVFRAVAVHPDGRRVLVARSAADQTEADPALDWVSLRGKRRTRAAVGPQLPADRLAIAPHGRSFATTHGREVAVWDEATRRQTAAAECPAAVLCLAYHPGGRRLAVGGADGVVRFFDADRLAESAAFDWRAGRVASIAFGPDGVLAAAGTDAGRVVVWDIGGDSP